MRTESPLWPAADPADDGAVSSSSSKTSRTMADAEGDRDNIALASPSPAPLPETSPTPVGEGMEPRTISSSTDNTVLKNNNNNEEEENTTPPPVSAVSPDGSSDPEPPPAAAPNRSSTDDAHSAAVVITRPVKRARTAYFIFTNDKRAQVQKQHPGESVAAIARVLGQMWANLAVEEKQQYQTLASQERERVAREVAAWEAAAARAEKRPADATGPQRTSSQRPLSDEAQSTALILPVARVRKIAKLDPEVGSLSKEALGLVTKAAELALAKLARECVQVAHIQNRRQLRPEDVAHVCAHRPAFMFLKEDIKDLAREQKKQQQQRQAEDSTMATSGQHKKSGAPSSEETTLEKPVKTLTSYFTTKPRADESC